MNAQLSFRQALLDLGLEDLIPLPEVPSVQEIRAICPEVTVEDLGAELIKLLRDGLIEVWSGHWSQDPRVVDSETAETLLRIEGHYEFNSPQDEQMRVYYVNVANLRSQ